MKNALLLFLYTRLMFMWNFTSFLLENGLSMVECLHGIHPWVILYSKWTICSFPCEVRFIFSCRLVAGDICSTMMPNKYGQFHLFRSLSHCFALYTCSSYPWKEIKNSINENPSSHCSVANCSPFHPQSMPDLELERNLGRKLRQNLLRNRAHMHLSLS